MSTTVGGIRIVDMPDLGAATAASSLVGERAGSGRFTLPAVQNFVMSSLGAVSIAQYGAVGDGATDNTAAITSAMAALGAGGGVVLMPPGTYRCTGPIVIPVGVSLRGAGRGSTTLLMACDANPNITMNTATELADVQIAGSGTQTGAMVYMQGNGAQLHDFSMKGYYNGILIQGVSFALADLAIGAAIYNGNMFSPYIGSGGGTGISADNFGGCMIDSMILGGPSSGTQPAASFRIKNGDTILLSNINATMHGAFLVQPPAANNTYGLTITSCLFDSAFATSAATFSPGGTVDDTVITNTWFGLSGAHGLVIAPVTGGSVTGMDVTGCEFNANAGGSGVRISGVAGAGLVSGINITGGRAEANSANGAHVDGVNISGVSFNGFRAGNYSGRGPNGGSGIITAGSLDHYVIVGCSLYGNTSTSLVDGASGTNKVVANNLVA